MSSAQPNPSNLLEGCQRAPTRQLETQVRGLTTLIFVGRAPLFLGTLSLPRLARFCHRWSATRDTCLSAESAESAELTLIRSEGVGVCSKVCRDLDGPSSSSVMRRGVRFHVNPDQLTCSRGSNVRSACKPRFLASAFSSIEKNIDDWQDPEVDCITAVPVA